ncbi:MAG: hypothetical protein COB60_07155 [Flavobacteriaceae bacterium]|nr:MAG: hypothetical protein COB60_07155 [Flavobacteriaceae bacterium]
MKTMKKYILIFSIFFTLVKCSNSNSQVLDDITQFNWRLVSIELENETVTVSEGSYVNDSSYTLKFLENSTFSLDTSINATLGKYTINDNLLEFTDYQELSEAGTDDPEQLRINEILLQQLEKATKFHTEHNNLILLSNGYTFNFKKIDL